MFRSKKFDPDIVLHNTSASTSKRFKNIYAFHILKSVFGLFFFLPAYVMVKGCLQCAYWI